MGSFKGSPERDPVRVLIEGLLQGFYKGLGIGFKGKALEFRV